MPNPYFKLFFDAFIMWKLSDYQYALPPELIAFEPVAVRSHSRLMSINSDLKSIKHNAFLDLPQFLQAGDLLVFNNTRVMKARLFAKKETGAKVEILIERVLDHQYCLAHLKSNRPIKIGSLLLVTGEVSHHLVVEEKEDFLFKLKLLQGDFWSLMEKFGQIPLPPYIEREADIDDETRYQTIFAQKLGAVAAPTAALHFDEAMIENLQSQGIEIAKVTLHVGAGTFKPVKCEHIIDHDIHKEWFEISAEAARQINLAKKEGRRIVAVGTTALRVLESITGEFKESQGETAIFIYPGYQFKTVKALLTNFHLPGSTLLMLVSALAGHALIFQAYDEAIKHQYRFFSYGDAMFIHASSTLS